MIAATAAIISDPVGRGARKLIPFGFTIAYAPTMTPAATTAKKAHSDAITSHRGAPGVSASIVIACTLSHWDRPVAAAV